VFVCDMWMMAVNMASLHRIMISFQPAPHTNLCGTVSLILHLNLARQFCMHDVFHIAQPLGWIPILSEAFPRNKVAEPEQIG
jgi:hypothetical protein